MGIDYTKGPAGGGGPAAGGPGQPRQVSLTKASPTVSLTKQGSAVGELRVNLNWNGRPATAPGGGFLKRLAALGGGDGGIDLDLACLWELTDGSKGVIQALGNAFGALDTPPFAQLDGDDRSGSATGGENLRVNLSHLAEIRRVLVFAFIYEGVASFATKRRSTTSPETRRSAPPILPPSPPSSATTRSTSCRSTTPPSPAAFATPGCRRTPSSSSLPLAPPAVAASSRA